MKLSSYLSFALLLLSRIFATAEVQLRIIGGKSTNISNKPYMVAVYENNKHFCAGSLVSLRHVLTAAHCLIGASPGRVYVRAGSTNLKKGGQVRNISRFFYPKSFSLKNMHQDVGMIVLQRAFTAGPRVATIPLCTRKLAAGTRMLISGWGTTGEKRTASAKQLRTATVYITNRKRCAKQYRRTSQRITNSMVCAGRGKRDACSGDSGGPGVVKGKVCAVVSYGRGCGRRRYPGVYTSLNNKAVRRMVKKWMKR